MGSAYRRDEDRKDKTLMQRETESPFRAVSTHPKVDEGVGGIQGGITEQIGGICVFSWGGFHPLRKWEMEKKFTPL
jgi:hypothetical protein